MPEKNKQYWTKCLKHWLCGNEDLDLNIVCTLAEQARKKNDYATAIAVYEKAMMSAQKEFMHETENPEREFALLELARLYRHIAEETKQELDLTIKEADDCHKRIAQKMEEKCPKTEQDKADLEKITNPATREAVSELMTFRNYSANSINGIENIRRIFNKDYEECEKKNKR